MDETSRRFYSRVFGNVMLNLHAVQQGFYPLLLCEMDHPTTAMHWRNALPQVMEAMKQRRLRGY
jgi:hypothetical protein